MLSRTLIIRWFIAKFLYNFKHRFIPLGATKFQSRQRLKLFIAQLEIKLVWGVCFPPLSGGVFRHQNLIIDCWHNNHSLIFLLKELAQLGLLLDNHLFFNYEHRSFILLKIVWYQYCKSNNYGPVHLDADVGRAVELITSVSTFNFVIIVL
jgi:hypothetical protein